MRRLNEIKAISLEIIANGHKIRKCKKTAKNERRAKWLNVKQCEGRRVTIVVSGSLVKCTEHLLKYVHLPSTSLVSSMCFSFSMRSPPWHAPLSGAKVKAEKVSS